MGMRRGANVPIFPTPRTVAPAQAGAQYRRVLLARAFATTHATWVPACAGTTNQGIASKGRRARMH